MKISGVVRNRQQQEPVAGAIVVLTIDNTDITTVETASDGTFEHVDEVSYVGQVLHYHVEKTGYKRVKDSRTIKDETIDLQILLEPPPPPPPPPPPASPNVKYWKIAYRALIPYVLISSFFLSGEAGWLLVNWWLIAVMSLVLVARWPIHLGTMAFAWLASAYVCDIAFLLGVGMGWVRRDYFPAHVIIQVFVGINLLLIFAIHRWRAKLSRLPVLNKIIQKPESG